jgi:hypothetical protein
MRRLLRQELTTTYLDPEVHQDLTVAAATERKPIREVLETAIQKYIESNPTLQVVVEAARQQAVT